MTKTLTMPRPAVLSPFFEGCDRWVSLVDIMARETCEGRLLSSPRDREGVRQEYGDPRVAGRAMSWPGLLADLRTNGLRYPVMYDERTGQLGNGHHRVVAAYDIGWSHLPTVGWDPGDEWDVMGADTWYLSGGEPR